LSVIEYALSQDKGAIPEPAERILSKQIFKVSLEACCELWVSGERSDSGLGERFRWYLILQLIEDKFPFGAP
jgi:hypothetical protein